MKKLLFFLLASVFLISCGGAGKEPTDLISWGTAFNYCMTTASYVIFLIISAAVLAVVTFISVRSYQKASIDGMGVTWRILLAVVFFACCLFIRPGEIAANTTVEQAARGAWIGY